MSTSGKGTGHTSEGSLRLALEDARRLVKVGGTYHHYKRPEHHYVISNVALLEATEEPAVVYQALHGEGLTWIRPLSEFLSEVEVGGERVKRFIEVKG